MKKMLISLFFVLPLLSFAQEIEIIRPGQQKKIFRFNYRGDYYREPRNSFSIFPKSVSRSLDRVFDRIFDGNRRQGNYYGTIIDRHGFDLIIRPYRPRTQVNREIMEEIRRNIRKARGVRI